MNNYSLITLGELLSSENETIKRNAIGILKSLQKLKICNIKGCDKFAGSRYYEGHAICDKHASQVDGY